MRFTRFYILWLVVCIGICSCNGENSEKVTEWYGKTKEVIIDHSELTHDRKEEVKDTISNRKELRYYAGAELLKLEIYEAGLLTYIAQYPADTSLCLVYELCEHGKVVYEGMDFRHKPIGLSTWYHCANGRIREQGQRIKFKNPASGKYMIQAAGL